MPHTFPRKPKRNDSAIVNFGINKNSGTYWVAYEKRGNIVHYFASFRDLKPHY